MNKNLIVAAIVALAGAFTFNTSAQQNDNKAKACPQQQCIIGQRAGGPTAYNPFEGLNLSKDQESKLQALQQQCKADRKAAKEQNKAMRRQAGNDQRRKMLNDIKAILSPEQYVQFLENNFVNGGQKFKDGKKDRARMDKKKFRGDRMRRPDLRSSNETNQDK